MLLLFREIKLYSKNSTALKDEPKTLSIQVKPGGRPNLYVQTPGIAHRPRSSLSIESLVMSSHERPQQPGPGLNKRIQVWKFSGVPSSVTVHRQGCVLHIVLHRMTRANHRHILLSHKCKQSI